MIYVDNMGHCYSDSSLDELYEFCVVKMGLRPEWNHYSEGFPHFDLIDKSYRAAAVEAGATPIANKEMLKLVRGGSSPFARLHETPGAPIMAGHFRGRPVTRIDFAAYFARAKRS